MKIAATWEWIWKHKICLLLGGLLVVIIMLVTSNTNMYQMRVSYIYPGAENGLYPDGQRLLRDDLISTERTQEALDAMRAKGWYTDISLKQIRDNLTVREYLSNPVQEKVEALRAQGREYTYYNNEFIITFVQPRALHIKNSSDFFGLARPDRSKEFVEELLRAVVNTFLREHTEGVVFSDFSDYMQVGDSDYDAVIAAYSDKVDLCINYLQKKKDADSTFVSPSTNLSFDDLITGYQSLADVQIERLNKYTKAEKISKSLEELVNCYKVDIENLRLNQKKSTDEHNIAQSAMLEYDHTFSENIIIVSVNEENGLYQARPKTAYDTVTQRALTAGVSSSVAGNTADDYERMIRDYRISMGEGENVAGKITKANDMTDAIYTEYKRLSELSASTIVDYIDQTNSNYIKTSPVENSGISISQIIKWCVYFGIGVCLGAALCFIFETGRRKKTIKG